MNARAEVVRLQQAAARMWVHAHSELIAADAGWDELHIARSGVRLQAAMTRERRCRRVLLDMYEEAK